MMKQSAVLVILKTARTYSNDLFQGFISVLLYHYAREMISTEGLELTGQEFPGQRWNSPDKLLPAKDIGIPRTSFASRKMAKHFTENT